MGCTSSQDTTDHRRPTAKAAAATLAAQKKKAKAVEIVEVGADESDKLKEDMMQRHDSEVDLTQHISAEREALRAISSVKIVRKLSFEDLVDSLTPKDYERLCSRSYCFKLQKEHRIATLRKEIAQRKRTWVVYNNLEAISDYELTIIGVYMMGLLRAVNDGSSKNSILPPPNANYNRSSTDLFRQSFGRFPTSPQAAAGISALNPITSGPYLLKMEEHIRDLHVVNIAPVSYYQVSNLTLYDYEFPPGLITINEAISLIELYRRGGRLTPKSVHKILRLSYKLLHKQKNITPVTLSDNDKLIVVGDLHGQLADLLHILTAAGLPSTHNKYIFNGDFVDRGEWGIEVICILLTLFIARPDCVVLNRGNHEDFAICSVYGFQLECYEKYDPLTFSLFVEVFQQIPLFAVVNDTVFVVHGGLFHNQDVMLDDLNKIERTLFTLEDLPENGELLEPVSRGNPKEFYKQLTRDALWSDPVDYSGLHESVRGAGVAFGPDITRNFLENNGLKLVIRSHECIRSGYDEPFASETADTTKAPLLCTIFSASDYGGSGNSAAYMEFHLKPPEVDEEQIRLEFSRTNSTMSVEGSSSSKRNSAKPFKRASLSIKHSDLPALLPALPTNDNTGDIKYIEETRLYYQVHYFYAEPLQLHAENENEDRISLSYTATADDLLEGNLTTRDRIGNGSALHLDLINLTNTVSSSPDNLSPLSNPPNDNHNTYPTMENPTADEGLTPKLKQKTRRISFGGTTVMMDEEQHDKEQSLVRGIDPTVELLQDRKIVSGSATKIEELILTRKQLLLESFEANDIEKTGLVSQQDWMKIMFEVLNISISWRKVGRYLVREEDRVPSVEQQGIDRQKEKEKEASIPRGAERLDRLRKPPIKTPISNSIIDPKENFHIKYLNFLARFEDEDTKKKREEQENFTLSILRRYQSSQSSISGVDSNTHSSGDSNSSLKEEIPPSEHSNGQKHSEVAATVKEDPTLISLTDYNRIYGSQTKIVSAETNPVTATDATVRSSPSLFSVNDEKHYFGYEIPEYVIASIYSSYKQIEHLFLCIDENKDGFISLSDLTKIAGLLKVNEIIQSEISDYPMIKNIRFSPQLIMNLIDIDKQDCVDMNGFFEVFRLSILNKLYARDGSSKPLLARETSYAMELHRLTHANSLLFVSSSTTATSQMVSPSLKHPQHQSALSSLELKKGIEISVDNELTMAQDQSENIGLSIDI